MLKNVLKDQLHLKFIKELKYVKDIKQLKNVLKRKNLENVHYVPINIFNMSCIITLFPASPLSRHFLYLMAVSWLLMPVLQVVHNVSSDKDGDSELFQDI